MPIEKNFTEKIEKADKVEFELYKHNRWLFWRPKRGITITSIDKLGQMLIFEKSFTYKLHKIKGITPDSSIPLIVEPKKTSTLIINCRKYLLKY